MFEIPWHCPQCGTRWVGEMVAHFQRDGRCSVCLMDGMLPKAPDTDALDDLTVLPDGT